MATRGCVMSRENLQHSQQRETHEREQSSFAALHLSMSEFIMHSAPLSMQMLSTFPPSIHPSIYPPLPPNHSSIHPLHLHCLARNSSLSSSPSTSFPPPCAFYLRLTDWLCVWARYIDKRNRGRERERERECLTFHQHPTHPHFIPSVCWEVILAHICMWWFIWMMLQRCKKTETRIFTNVQWKICSISSLC